MKKQFVTYDIAIQLKKLGFNSPCIAYYYTDIELNNHKDEYDYRKHLSLIDDINDESDYAINNINLNHYVAAPLWEQIVEWLRDTYQIYITLNVDCTTEPKYTYTISIFNGNPNNLASENWWWDNKCSDVLYRDYNEAKKKGILKTIELINEQGK